MSKITIEQREGASGGLSFLGALTILFIALKLLNVITWSWLWVLAPVWLPPVCLLGLVPGFLVLYGFVWCICALIDLWDWYRK
jgi:hypothetical protein